MNYYEILDGKKFAWQSTRQTDKKDNIKQGKTL